MLGFVGQVKSSLENCSLLWIVHTASLLVAKDSLWYLELWVFCAFKQAKVADQSTAINLFHSDECKWCLFSETGPTRDKNKRKKMCTTSEVQPGPTGNPAWQSVNLTFLSAHHKLPKDSAPP